MMRIMSLIRLMKFERRFAILLRFSVGIQASHFESGSERRVLCRGGWSVSCRIAISTSTSERSNRGQEP